jgi:hypothetical protein
VRRAGALMALVWSFAVLTGCGGGSESTVSETAANLGDIKSGELALSLLAEGGEARAGFELTGPFELRESGLPVAELAYTQIADTEEATVTFISTGEEAFVEANGQTYVLPEEQAARLRAAGGELGGGSDDSGGDSSGGLEALGLEEWLIDPEVSEGDEVDGAETERISGELDVVEAANDLLALVAAFGGGDAGQIEGQDAENLRRATERATVEILTGKEDRLLRSLEVDLRLSADAPDDLLEQLGPLGQAHFRLELGIANPNEPVSVEAPADAQPFPAE